MFVKYCLTRIIQFVYISVETLSLRKSGQSSEFGANGESAPNMLRICNFFLNTKGTYIAKKTEHIVCFSFSGHTRL